eukprot:609475-Rhodomonas_salina.3
MAEVGGPCRRLSGIPGYPGSTGKEKIWMIGPTTCKQHHVRKSWVFFCRLLKETVAGLVLGNFAEK